MFFFFPLAEKKQAWYNFFMKILHCSDIHLESKLSALPHNKALLRRGEILESFCSLMRQAQADGFGAFIVAGDLFEGNVVAPSTKTALVSAFCDCPDVDFIILTGNHDGDAFGADFVRRLPANVHVLGRNGMEEFVKDGVCFVGADMTETTMRDIQAYPWKKEYYNVFICHGDIGKDSEDGAIDLDGVYDLAGDDIAMGHIHSFHIEGAGRGYAAYSGCLEPRGYDETGEKGFVIVNTEILNRADSIAFAPYARRLAWQINLDVSDCADKSQIVDKARSLIGEGLISENDMVEFYLVGEVAEDCVFTEMQIKNELKKYLFDVKVRDKTKLRLDIEALKGTPSLKAEFITLAEKEIPDEEMRNTVIRYALNALNGEEIDEL